MTRITPALVLITVFLFLSLFFSKIHASTTLFSDNFNDNDISDWKVARNVQWGNLLEPCLLDFSKPATWVVDNGRVGIKISSYPCVTELVPANFKLPNETDYSYSFDMEFSNTISADRNVIFRYKDSSNWYDLKFYDFQIYFQKVVENNASTQLTFFLFQANRTYNFKIDYYHNDKFLVFIDGVKIWEVKDFPPFISDSTIGLQASVGSNPLSEVWFDNILVTSIDSPNRILSVPYFSQNDLPWEPTEYDSAQSLGFLDPTMNRWGCAVTSAAMVLNYHQMMQFADNTPIDPGSLNDWLKKNKGYLKGVGSDGPYSYLSWPAISRLTKELFDAGKAPYKLEHKRAYPSSTSATLINDDLIIRKIPDILQVKNASTSGHFVVAKGIVGNTYSLNDPEWNVPTLTSFSNTYYQIDRYVMSSTDLSYIVVVSNPNVEVLITDPQSRRTGKKADQGVTSEFSEIPDATYTFEDPISNPNSLLNPEKLGTGVNASYFLNQSMDHTQLKHRAIRQKNTQSMSLHLTLTAIAPIIYFSVLQMHYQTIPLTSSFRKLNHQS